MYFILTLQAAGSSLEMLITKYTLELLKDLFQILVAYTVVLQSLAHVSKNTEKCQLEKIIPLLFH